MMRCSVIHIVGALSAAAIAASCSLIVDTSGLARNATDASSADSSAEAAPPAGPDASAAEVAGQSVADGGCGVLQAACSRSSPCCAGLQCGDDHQCLTCLPLYDDCTSNDQCCNKRCDPAAAICM
jgi:hypothetical protein